MLTLLLHSYGEFDRANPVGPRVWPHFDLLTVHSGRLALRVGGQNVFLGRYGSVLIYPNTPFDGKTLSHRVAASVQHFAVNRDHSPPNPVLASLIDRREGFERFDRVIGRRVARDIDRAMTLATLGRSPWNDALREAHLVVVLGLLRVGGARQLRAPHPNAELRQALEWAREQNGAATTRALAARAGFSGTHLRRLLAGTLRTSPHRFLVQLRMNEAKRLLRETRLPLKSIAATLGYADAVSFHRAFAREARLPPGAFRRRFAPRG